MSLVSLGTPELIHPSVHVARASHQLRTIVFVMSVKFEIELPKNLQTTVTFTRSSWAPLSVLTPVDGPALADVLPIYQTVDVIEWKQPFVDLMWLAFCDSFIVDQFDISVTVYNLL
ncbi:hypothetical protein Taro_006251 [Colocasia esculenta]|uniref:Uncharacterized protein n=1 Tax=Colocasia esculenta TaxID=4460 RepID=A0A843U082_COLES|nr:hypothetical protein [Colocasia esculenta]